MAVSFAKRVKLFSSRSDKNKIKKVIQTNLRLNDYPITLVNRIINRLGEKPKPQTATVQNENKISRSLTNI